jgi:hypothetical protein
VVVVVDCAGVRVVVVVVGRIAGRVVVVVGRMAGRVVVVVVGRVGTRAVVVGRGRARVVVVRAPLGGLFDWVVGGSAKAVATRAEEVTSPARVAPVVGGESGATVVSVEYGTTEGVAT